MRSSVITALPHHLAGLVVRIVVDDNNLLR